MKVLIAEDDPFFRRLLQQLLVPECEVSTVEDGVAACRRLQENDGPTLAILDWVMPGMAGPQVCREVRANPRISGAYLILLTAKNSSADILAGLRAGADDYVTKPFEPEELRARVRVGRRIIELQAALAAKETELETMRAREELLQTRVVSLEESREPQPMSKSASA